MTTPVRTIPNLPVDEWRRYGVAVTLFPSAASAGYDYELQRAPDLAGAPDTANAVTLSLPARTSVYFDELPNDGATRHYRLRCTAEGETPSAWTDWVAAAPRLLFSAEAPEGPQMPAVRAETAESATTGSLTVSFTDPQRRVTAFEMATQVDAGAWSAWASYSGLYAGTIAVSLVEGRVSKARYRLTGYNALGQLVTLAEDVVTFTAASKPGIPQVFVDVDDDGAVQVRAFGDEKTASFRYGVSTVAQPSAASVAAAGAVAEGRTLELTAAAGTVASRGFYYVTVLAYPEAGAAGTASEARYVRAARDRSALGIDTSGYLVTDLLRVRKIVGASKALAEQFDLVPNADFDGWASASQPAHWAVDTAGGAAAAMQDVDVSGTTVAFSGNRALAYANPDLASNGGWHGVATATPDGASAAYTVPMMPGRTYRLLVASKVQTNDGTLTDAPKYRVFLYHKDDGSVYQSKELPYRAHNAWQVDEWVLTVPTTAGPRSALYVQFNRNPAGSGQAMTFFLDSLWLEEAESRRRMDTVIPGDAQVNGTVQVKDGTNYSRLARNRRVVTGLTHGAAVAFDPPFVGTPFYVLRGGIVHQPDSAAWSTPASYNATKYQTPNLFIDGLTGSGGTLVAQLRQLGGGTNNRSDSYGAQLLDAAAEEATVSPSYLASEASADNSYRVTFDVDMSLASNVGETATLQLEVGLYVDLGSGPVLRDSRTYVVVTLADGTLAAESWPDESFTISQTGVDSTDDFTLKIISLTQTGGYSASAEVVCGALEYATSTAALITATMTPDSVRVTADALETA